MTAVRTCACGASLPDDKRVKRCDACKGAAVREQDRIRSLRKIGKFRDRIWWLYFRNALRFVVWVRAELGTETMPRPVAAGDLVVINDWTVSGKGLASVARAAGVKRVTLKSALAGEPIDKRAFDALCTWMGWPPHVFEHVSRDPKNLPLRSAGRAA